MASLLPDGTTSVVDLAAGGGALLCAATKRFDHLTVAAVDLDSCAVRLLRSSHPDWLVSRADSLLDVSYRSSAAYSRRGAGYDAVLLNPPFSYRGQARERVYYRGVVFRVTPATSFVLRALDWIHDDGLVVAIIPDNVMNIDGDRELWNTWHSDFLLERKRFLNHNTFQGARTTAMVVTLRPAGRPKRRFVRARAGGYISPALASDCSCVEIIRGRVPVYQAGTLATNTGAPFIHTTALRAGMVKPGSMRLPRALSSIGPFVLLPRVGRPDPAKIVLSTLQRPVLSDCVIGLRAIESCTQHAVYELLASEFDYLASLYTGSCAPYITIERLAGWLRESGFLAGKRSASAEPGRCECRSSAAARA
ncbi:methyltransferase [Mycobacteroides chelonae]|uniref:methyltransferase n=1 Tax=Mycobacteroides chelonae TaxID=1774 RepID=UPI003986E9F5